MQTGDNGSTTVALQVKRISFLEEEIALKKLSKELSKTSKEAIDILVSMLKSVDEKIRMQAATKLLEFDIDVKKAVANEQLQRMVAEIKLNGNGGSRSLEIENSKSNRPIVNFSEIRSIE